MQYYVPIKKFSQYDSTHSTVKIDNFMFNLRQDSIKTDEEIGKEFLARYADAIKRFLILDEAIARDLVGTSILISALEVDQTYFIEKIEEYFDNPKIGEIWECKDDLGRGIRCVVIGTKNNCVYYYVHENEIPIISSMFINEFKNSCVNTGEKTEHIEQLMRELRKGDKNDK